MNPPTPHLVLVSHALCPYVQRAAIVLAEKGVAFERRDIDLAAKPDWFLRISPLGKTPVLLVDGEPIFESAVICDYLDETLEPRLHPADALQRARQRGWVEFGSQVLNAVAAFYGAADAGVLRARADDLRRRLERIESELGSGPYFGGASFSIVDAAFGPVFRYFDVFDTLGDFGLRHGLPKVQRWREALAARPSVAAAVGSDYERLLRDFLQRRGFIAVAAEARRAAAAPATAVHG
jgi:glutathione S-transferase